MTNFKSHKHLLRLVIILISQCAFAQKLPKVQTASVWAPANIKIDGKALEWDDRFQAHNNSNHLYYTLSNDGDNLYLIVRMEDLQGDKKIFRGGIIFSIIPSNKKAEKISVRYPVITWEKTKQLRNSGGNHLVLYKDLKSNERANKAKIDSLIALSNKELEEDYKEIEITGMPEISDTSISIYNQEGIKVSANFDKQMKYTYELAIPLKFLGTAINNAKSIRYNIMLNTTKSRPKIDYSKPVKMLESAGPVPLDMNNSFDVDDSDFSGTYTLAKNP